MCSDRTRSPTGPDPLYDEIEGMIVATADRGDQALDVRVHEALAILRRKMNMDVVFVSRFADGKRIIELVDAAPGREVVRAGDSDPLEESWCQHVVTGRLPQLMKDSAPLRASGDAPATGLEIGSHLSVPVTLKDGQVFGTLCTFAFHVNDDVSLQDVWRLRAVAQLIASRLDAAV